MADHGTPGAYIAHHRAGEDPCDVCKKGMQSYRIEWLEANPDKQAEYRRRAQADRVALRRLRATYPGDYLRFRAEALQEAS